MTHFAVMRSGAAAAGGQTRIRIRKQSRSDQREVEQHQQQDGGEASQLMHSTATDVRMDSLPAPLLPALERAGQWMLHSGIQEPEGGVARFHRTDTQRNNPVSTEITGYQASALTYLHQVTGAPEYRERAVETARFLTRRAWNEALQIFPFEYPEPSPAYFFDCGIIIRGLLAVWRMTREPEFLEVATACGDGMLEAFDAGFDFHPVLELPSKAPAVRDPRWSRSSGCYQLKVALGLQELAEASGGERFREAWERLLAEALREHREFLPGHSDRAKVMDRLHAYCYFLEALLPALPQRAMAEGIQRVAYFLHTIAPEFARSDVYAQLLRMRLYADSAGVLPIDEATAATEAESLAKFQREDGGFYFGRNEKGFLPFTNPVSTAFGMQALAMWDDHRRGLPLPDRRLLI